MLSVGHRIPKKNILLSTGDGKQKAEMLSACAMLRDHGYKLFATPGTSRYLTENGIENTMVHWPSEADQHPQALDMLHNKEIDMVVNVNKNLSTGELTNGYKIRRAAIDSEHSSHHQCPIGFGFHLRFLHRETRRFGNS